MEKYISVDLRADKCNEIADEAVLKPRFVQLKERVRELKKKVGHLNHLLKEALDKNIGIQNKIRRLELHSNNQKAQIENL